MSEVIDIHYRQVAEIHPKAWDDLTQRLVRRVMYLLSGNQTAAEDVVQNAILALWKTINKKGKAIIFDGSGDIGLIKSYRLQNSDGTRRLISTVVYDKASWLVKDVYIKSIKENIFDRVPDEDEDEDESSILEQAMNSVDREGLSSHAEVEFSRCLNKVREFTVYCVATHYQKIIDGKNSYKIEYYEEAKNKDQSYFTAQYCLMDYRHKDFQCESAETIFQSMGVKSVDQSSLNKKVKGFETNVESCVEHKVKVTFDSELTEGLKLHLYQEILRIQNEGISHER